MPAVGGGGNGGGSTGGGSDQDKSRGGAVTPESWARSLLTAIGAPLTQANIDSVVSWEAREGGNWRNTATYNPLNTTQDEPGSHPVNAVGVQAYDTWAEGLDATTTTLTNGRYADILAALRSGKGLEGKTFHGLDVWSSGSYDSLQPRPGYGGGTGASIQIGGSAGAGADCLVSNPFGTNVGFGPVHLGMSLGSPCLFTKSNARAFIGAGLMLLGLPVAMAGLVVLGVAAGMRALGPAGKVAEGVGGALMLVPGAEGAGAAVSAAGRAAKNPAAEGRRRGAARQRQAAQEERDLRRQVGEPKENPDLEVRGGMVRESGEQRAARKRRESAAARARARRSAGQGRPASREETGF